MEYVKFGNTGLMVSPLCLGTMSYGGPTKQFPWALKDEESRPFIKKALELGINFFDTANVYNEGGSEETVGKALKEFAGREDYVLATKVFNPVHPADGPNKHGLSRKHIMNAIDGSLTRLGVDYVDLYQIHRWDEHTPIGETMEALHDIVKAGKARYIGASSMYSWQFAQAQYTADLNGWTRFVSMQPHYNLIYREEEREMIPFCIDQKIAIIPWSPLAAGLLGRKDAKDQEETKRAKTDNFSGGYYNSPSDYDVIERVHQVAKDKGVPPAQLSLAWMMNKPEITAPIVGATKPGHIEDAVAALSLKLSQEEINLIEELYQPHRVIGFDE
ncbi:aldo/keto reductase [Mucilaginibacter lappiensis]|uniref:aldo/keto reductase n=1 Tax=Mucilaginibacter lappiensis TaxID=354630 RepID=UPI003D21CDAC